MSPEKRIFLYDDAQWEEFVLEWATTLDYVQVLRNGGANDHGVDVAGFVTAAGFEDDWDCYQCKHYGKALIPSDAYPEILKIVVGVMAGHYRWPRRYRFAAPKGCGTSLSNLIHSPTKLRAGLEQELVKTKSVLVKQLGGHLLEAVVSFIRTADFSVFGTVELCELVEQHSKTRWHAARFGVDLPARPDSPAPSPEPSIGEQRYIEQMLDAYAERHGSTFTATEAAAHEHTGGHYMRQRVAFYSAEALRLFARDSVPVGTFDALQREIFDGVIDVHDLDHRDGLQRLQTVVGTSHTLAITSNGLLPIVEVRDRTGMCHQLANDNRLRWCHATPQ
ncbi:ABC-three component system protein [Rhodococcus erythropolis]|uniref:ABC-three component system protein n=1 Tax=Rhodococcus erythropolis TaxID=1833 RepID=UPI00056423C2|nr:ABC-three component system protein [Rhodococcus erythropolis]